MNMIHYDGQERAINLDECVSIDKGYQVLHHSVEFEMTTGSLITWSFKHRDERDVIYDEIISRFGVELVGITVGGEE